MGAACNFGTHWNLFGSHPDESGSHRNSFGSHPNPFGSHWNLPLELQVMYLQSVIIPNHLFSRVFLKFLLVYPQDSTHNL